MTAVLHRPVSSIHGADLEANFDYAASAPALDAVVDRVREVLPYCASVHRGAGVRSRECTREYEAARAVVHRFCGADDDDVVVFTRNTTDALNLLARCVPGDTVVLDIEHHAALLPWVRRRVVRSAPTLRETIARVEAELRARPAALLVVTGASNVTGEVLPLEELAETAHRAGARILVDGAQLVPHRGVDITASGIDYLAFSGHKLYAPFGSGVLVGKRDWLDAAQPYLAGGGASLAVDTAGDPSWALAPARHEGGTPNLLGAVAIAAACEKITEIGYDAIAAHDEYCTSLLLAGLASLDGVDVLRIWSDTTDTVGIASFTVAGLAPDAIASALADRGFAVRAGKFCAHPLLARLGAADGAVRASIGFGTTPDEVERLVQAVGVTCVSPGWSG